VIYSEGEDIITQLLEHIVDYMNFLRPNWLPPVIRRRPRDSCIIILYVPLTHSYQKKGQNDNNGCPQTSWRCFYNTICTLLYMHIKIYNASRRRGEVPTIFARHPNNFRIYYYYNVKIRIRWYYYNIIYFLEKTICTFYTAPKNLQPGPRRITIIHKS